MATLRQQLSRYRRHLVKRDMLLLAWRSYFVLLLAAMGLILIEQVYYFKAATRLALLIFSFTIVSLFVLSGLGFLWALKTNRLAAYRWRTLAQAIGHRAFKKPDTVLNALELEAALDSSQAAALSRLSIQKVQARLERLEPQRIFPPASGPWKRGVLILLIFFTLWLVVSGPSGAAAVYRWWHPTRDFPVPTPFTLRNLTGDIHLLGGETATIAITSDGPQPDSVFLALQPLDSAAVTVLAAAQDSGVYRFTVQDVYSDYRYQAFVPARHFWQAWDSVRTEPYRIQVTNRPLIEAFRMTVTPPAYARLQPVVYRGNKANIQALAGSRLALYFRSNRPLRQARYRWNGTGRPMALAGQSATAQFLLQEPGTFTLHFSDNRGIENRDPIPYQIQIIPDTPPSLTILTPEPTVDLGDDLTLALALEIEDDFGFSSLQVGYEVRRPAYLNTDPYMSVLALEIEDPYRLSQTINAVWDLSNLGLMPEDEVHYHFELYDNDTVNGPKQFVSPTYLARLPSLADLYTSLETEEAGLMDAGQLSKEALETVQKGLEDLQLELLKSENLDWEKQQAVHTLLREAQAQMEALETVTEQLATLQEFGEKHGLFDRELLTKFQQLQDLVQSLLSEELRQSLEAVQEALETLQPEDLQAALDDLSRNLDQMENTLDRYLDIFQRMQAEQKMAEVVKRINKLTQQQQHLDEEIADLKQDGEAGDYARLEQEEAWNRDELERIAESMKEAAEALAEYSPTTAEEMDQLPQSPLMEAAFQALENTQSALGNQNQAQAQQSSEASLENLSALQEKLAALQQQFQSQTGQAMAAQFQRVLRNVLTLSKAQEALAATTAQTPRTSPRLSHLAGQQQTLRDQLTHIMASLMDLSRQTFAVTPDMGREVGTAFAAMERAKADLAERNLTQARQRQAAALTGLNAVALSLFQTAQNMQSGKASASGFEQFMARMQEMAGQQQGLNQQGLQLGLGQMTAGMQQALLQRMLQGQQQVRKSLNQLLREMQASGTQSLGDMRGIGKEMDQVIRDLQAGRYTRQTRKRQQRILSRMLDSQKALSRRGKKEERKSTTAGDYLPYAGPGGLPADRGQRRSLSLEALNRSLKAGYSSDYQDMIRRYFNRLAEMEMNRGGEQNKEADHEP